MSTTVYAPLASLGLGTGNAAVIDQRDGRLVRFRLDRVVLVRNVACVACESVMVVDGLHRATLPDGRAVWVRDVRDVLDADADAGDPAADPGYEIADQDAAA